MAVVLREDVVSVLKLAQQLWMFPRMLMLPSSMGKGLEGQIESTNEFVRIDRDPLSPDMRRQERSRSRNNSNSSQTHFADAEPVETQINIPPRDVSFGQTPDTPRGFGEHRGVKGPQLDNIPYRFGGGDGRNDSDEMKNSWWSRVSCPPLSWRC
jgi:hypothetical protein